jgi:UDP-glucuronate decarboxylase
MHQGKKYALVAGGSGFIGSHLVESLIEDDWVVDVIDNFSTGNVDNLRSTMNASRELSDGSLSLKIMQLDVVSMQQDPARTEIEFITPYEGAARFIQEKGTSRYDVVYNLACPASPKAYQADPIGTMMTNVVGTANLLALAEAHGSIFLQASTSEVYGDPQQHPQKEDYWGNVNPYGARSCYDEGKRSAETLCYEFRQRGLDVRVARIFNTYGPRMHPDDGRVISNFVRQAIEGEPLTVYGEGTQTRSFCYVSDMVVALRKLAEIDEWEHGPVNVGNDSEFKVMELVEILSEWFPRILAVKEPLPKDDPTVRRPDLSLAKSKLTYFPGVPLRKGLHSTIAWMRLKMSKG